MENNIINLCHALDYKNGTQISKLLGKADKDELKELKPYMELSKEETISILQVIVPFLSTKGEPSKQELGLLKLDSLGVVIENVEPPVVEDGKSDVKTKAKALSGTTSSAKDKKEMKELKEKVSKLEGMYDEVLSEVVAIRKLLMIDQEQSKVETKEG